MNGKKDVQLAVLLKKLCRVKDGKKALPTENFFERLKNLIVIDEAKAQAALEKDFKKKDKKGKTVLNVDDLQTMVEAHGAHISKRYRKKKVDAEAAVVREFDARPHDFESFFAAGENGLLSKEEFFAAFEKQASFGAMKMC